jgi:phosphomannomutase
MEPLIISVSGLRGIIGQSLTPEVAVRYIAAFAASLEPGPVIVSRDGRASGPMLRDAIVASLQASGRLVLDAGVAATPTVGVLVRARHAAGAVQISASHNPVPYNGIKLFGSDGRVLNARRGAQVRDDYFGLRSSWQPVQALGHCTTIPDPHADHLAKILTTIDVGSIAKHRYRVVLDSNHGAGNALGARLLAALGCVVIELGAQPTGQFAHPPEPVEENLQSVGQRIVDERAVIGFCQDPDADRLALIDERGRYIGEELTLALCLQQALAERSGNVVINCATSGVNEAVAAQYGAVVHRSAVGEANVADMMVQLQAVFGGEGNGGPIDPAIGLVRDSFVGMARVLSLMAKENKSLAQLVDALPKLVIRKHKFTLPSEQLGKGLDLVQAAFGDASASRLDGLRLSWPGRWLLVRGSNTEPIVRLIAEAETAAAADALCDRAAEALRSLTA